MAIGRRYPSSASEEESYFVSMTDMMVGLLFIFIIMLMFFALKFQEAAVKQTVTTRALITSEETRSKILAELKSALESEGIAVEIEMENGILRLPEQILFERAKSELSDKGRNAVNALSVALGRVLPCYATVPGKERPSICPPSPHSIEAIMVEGHTDSDGTAEINWKLSVERSLTTYRALVTANQDLATLRNERENPQAVLSVSGYGRERPVRPNDTDENKKKNRRIDLRFIMLTPRASTIDKIEGQTEASPTQDGPQQ
jgi:chemotaxis protein MotB